MNHPRLKGPRVTLRTVQADDRDRMHDWENRPELDHLGNEHRPLTLQQIEEFIDHATGNLHVDGQLRFMIDLSPTDPPHGKDPLGHLHVATTIGCIDLFEFDSYNRRAGVGILIAEQEHRQKGYAKEAVQLLTDYCFEVLKMRQLFCHIPVDNLPSLQLFSGCGFKETGRCRDWVKKGNAFIDAMFMQKLNE